MDPETDTPSSEAVPLKTTTNWDSETAISGGKTEGIVNIPVAPTESTVKELKPSDADVRDREERIFDGDGVVPANVHVDIADDLASNENSEQITVSLIKGSTVVDPTLTEIYVDTSAIEPSIDPPEKMGALKEDEYSKHSPVTPSPANPGSDPVALHSNIITTLHDPLQLPQISSRSDVLADDDQTKHALGAADLRSSIVGPHIQIGESASQVPESASAKPVVLAPVVVDSSEKPPGVAAAVESSGESTVVGASIPAVPVQASSLQPQIQTEIAQVEDLSSTAQPQTSTTVRGSDPLMVQEAALLDVDMDQQKSPNESEAKSPLIGEMDWMVQEATLLDVQEKPADLYLQQQSAGEFKDKNSPLTDTLASEVHDEQRIQYNIDVSETVPDNRADSIIEGAQSTSIEQADNMIDLVDDDTSNDVTNGEITHDTFLPDSRKRPRVDEEVFSKPSGHIPQGFVAHAQKPQSVQIQPGASLGGLSIGSTRFPLSSHQRPQSLPLNVPEYIEFHNFTPTWNQLLPIAEKSNRSERRSFRLSLLNVNEFTITGLPMSFGGNPTPVAGLRASIKSISREHGKAVYERDPEGNGKWRIPLGAYHAFASFLQSDPLTSLEGIPQHQLQVASMERARQAQGYPSAEQLEEKGLPSRLATALAPFQRGGVDFVLSKNGRALIADDMGLGKTIQAVASMALYFSEWPLLVLCPSSARYHWESELLQWLGQETHNDTSTPEDGIFLIPSQINVLCSSKEEVFPSKSTKVVICSYGLVTALVESGKICPGMFDCAIVDESHMLKNKSSKRTSRLLPVLTATSRCVLLSGTPALARPAELWPQLVILGTERYGWWDDEAAFVDKYIKNGNAERSAELHTMLTGTVMIRRLKSDILKSLPRKLREKASFDILGPEQHLEFRNLLATLRQGKGTLGKLARIEHHASSNEQRDTHDTHASGPCMTGEPLQEEMHNAIKSLEAQIERSEMEGRIRIQNTLNQVSHQLSQDRYDFLKIQLESDFSSRLESQYKQGMDAINTRFHQNDANHYESKRTKVLARLYELTGQVKIPLIVDLLKRWLNDPTKGKLCIFAHHLSVLDAIKDLADLSNQESDGKRRFIRIDGSTTPKLRQEQIKIFQSDPTTRIALLGITAAGVAVTLTASSTVWFAELFWTPAIMIQAEDRCHRIGQQARVRCLYFVARGTIDDILWRLIEKKFSDLGEFVEGKENQKLVVDKTYHTIKELHDQFQGLDFDENEEVSDDPEFADDFLDVDLVHDIEMLGDEEQKMLQVSLEDDEALDPEPILKDSMRNSNNVKPASLKSDSLLSTSEEMQSGHTEDDAIALLDDDEDVRKADPTEPEAKPDGPAGFDSSHNFCSSTCRAYRIILKGPSLGLTIENYKGRIVVSRVSPNSENAKPSVGDIFASVNGVRFPIAADSVGILRLIRGQLLRGATEFIFLEEPIFASHFKGLLLRKEAERAASIPAHSIHKMAMASGEEVDVIEID